MVRASAIAALAALLWFPQGPAPPLLLREIRASSDVAWLERLCTDVRFAEAEYAARGRNTAGVKGNRSAAYVRLGALGSPQSLAAVHRIETAMRSRSVLAPSATPGTRFYHPAPHMGDGQWNARARTRLADGRDVAAFVLDLYGPHYLHVATGSAGRWTRPQMVPVPVIGYPGLTIAGLPGDRLRIAFVLEPRPTDPMSQLYPSPDAVEVLLPEIQRDRDGDGWTDITERYLQMHGGNTDSDGDGIPDDRDSAPLFREPASDKTDEDVQILKRSVFAMFGLTEAPGALFVADGSRHVQLEGLPGPVFYREGHGGVRVTWKIESKTPTEAIVELTDFEGVLAASGNELKLRKVDDGWYVVSIRMKWIS
jgi:hypothetical protein